MDAKAMKTVREVTDRFLVHARRRCSARQVTELERYLYRFCSEFGSHRVCDCKPYHLSGWIDANENWQSDWTCHGISYKVKRCFNWAVEQELIDRNPFATITYPRGLPRRPITDAEFQALLRATKDARQRRVLFFLRFSGSRPGEMANLEKEHLHFGRGVAILYRHKTARRTREARVIQLVPELVKMLRYQVACTPPNRRHVFLNQRNRPWDRHALGRMVKRLRRRAGLSEDVVLYTIRHGYGTNAILRGLDVATLAQLMGHKGIRSTQHYLHLAGEHEHLAKSAQQAIGLRTNGRKADDGADIAALLKKLIAVLEVHERGVSA